MQGLIADIEDATQNLPGKIGPDTILRRIEGWDSLALVAFIEAVDERYGIEVAVEDLTECETVADLHAMLQGKSAQRQAA